MRPPANQAWPMQPKGLRRCCPDGDKAGKSCGGSGPPSVNPSAMDQPNSPADPDGFSAAGPDVIAPGEGELIVNLEGFEGPLDLLLALAREQKVDLRRISMVALVDQYLAHVAQARRLRLELAADYLVMAAWLAYLKSRLLLPEPAAGEEPSGQEMGHALAWQPPPPQGQPGTGRRLTAPPPPRQ